MENGKFDDILLSCNAVYKQNTIEKCCILSFPKKCYLGINKDYRGMNLTPINAKVYITMLINRIQSEIEKIPWKNQNDPQFDRFLLSFESLKEYVQKISK